MKFMTPCLRLYFFCYFDLFKLHDIISIISMFNIVLIYDNCGDVLTLMMMIRMVMIRLMMMMMMMISTN